MKSAHSVKGWDYNLLDDKNTLYRRWPACTSDFTVACNFTLCERTKEPPAAFTEIASFSSTKKIKILEQHSRGMKVYYSDKKQRKQFQKWVYCNKNVA